MFVEDMDIEGADVEHSVSLLLLCCLQPVNLVWKYVWANDANLELRQTGSVLQPCNGNRAWLAVLDVSAQHPRRI